ncbi:annexin-B12-like [Patiria miniata]|uniref:Uncharacterized protein n=1 Tax=Patiria miniata TaxID=46514 RepID=A0A913ZLS9_PATMI|nr:annexin-B12-like [Patiria miniata]
MLIDEPVPKSKKGGIEKYLASEKGEVVDGYVALVKTAKGELIQFYVDQLYAAMKGLGTDDNLIIRTLISRSESCFLITQIDLANIKQEFHAKYGTTLENFVKDDTS